MKHLDRYIAELRHICSAIPDRRTGSNTQYRMEDIGLAAFSLFFMQHPSFLDFQKKLHQNIGMDNTQTLFGMAKIPTDNHIRKTLDGVNPSHFDDMFFYIFNLLHKSKPCIEKSCFKDHIFIALDGTEYFSSNKISCPACSTRELSNGNTEYFHTFLSATVVSPTSPLVFCLPPEFIVPQDGDNKQNCEFKAVKSRLHRVGPRCRAFNPIYLGDDLYAKHEIYTKIVNLGGSFIFTCKDSSHKTLAQFRKGLTLCRHGEIKRIGSQKREYRYSESLYF